jgi:hypothetical protein
LPGLSETQPEGREAWLTEPEGDAVPPGVSLFDAHVHLFPPGLFEALWRWFDVYAWNIRYRLHTEQVLEFLQARRVKRCSALLYAHKPGMSRVLNRYMAEVARQHPEIVPLGTIYPGETDQDEILREALGPLHLRGLKLHCHVQKMAADDPRFEAAYRACEEAGVPIVIHAGRSPSSPGYGVDTKELCAAAQVERVLQRFPRLRLLVPHLGADEFGDYLSLLQRYENLFLDTTMAIGGYFQAPPPASLFTGMAARLLYGSDFPNLPYAWDRELETVLRAQLPPETERALLYDNAARLFGE